MQVKKQAHAAGNRAVVPNVAYRRGKLDVAGALAANLKVGHFDAAAVANDALVADGLEFSAIAFPFLGGAENALAEKAVALRTQSAVVDCFRLLDFAVRPSADCVRAGQFYFNTVKIFDIAHYSFSLSKPLEALSINSWSRSVRAICFPLAS